MTKSAASLDVNVGSGEDPSDRAGLAHFLEHMLFLGSKKYPEANAFDDYVASHGGAHNAYTSLTHTNYFFDIDAKNFEEGIARFASMFESPQFSAQYVERERNAVNSEFTSKFADDYRRTRDVISEIVVKDHALSKFSTGNLASLEVATPRPLLNDLRDFFKRYYFADNMTLVVLAPESLDQLELKVDQYFSALPRSKELSFKTQGDLFPSNLLPARVNFVPIKETRTLSFMFPVGDLKPYRDQKPTMYIGHLLGHEAKGLSLIHI